MNKLILSSFVLGAIQASRVEVEEKYQDHEQLSYDEMFAGITSEMADQQNMDIDFVQEVMEGHPLDFQDTSEAYLGNNRCEWTERPRYKPSIGPKPKAMIKEEVCRVFKEPTNPLPINAQNNQNEKLKWLKADPQNNKAYEAYRKLYQDNFKDALQYKWVDKSTCDKLKGKQSQYMWVPARDYKAAQILKCWDENGVEKKVADTDEELKKKEAEEQKQKLAAQKKAAEDARKKNEARLKILQSRAEKDKYRKYPDGSDSDNEDKEAEAQKQKLASQKKAAEDAKKKAAEDAKRKAAEDAKKKAAEDARKKAAEDARKKAAEDARKKAAEDARKKKEAEDARKKAAEDARKKAVEDARKKKEAELKKKEAEKKKKESDFKFRKSEAEKDRYRKYPRSRDEDEEKNEIRNNYKAEQVPDPIKPKLIL